MQDFWFLGVVVVFFILSLGYTRVCDRL